MPVYKYLDLSTSHITKDDAQKLEENWHFLDALIIRRHDSYGWWIHVPVETEAAETLHKIIEKLLDMKFSVAIPTLLTYAMAKDCYWILLDRDAEVEESLPVYDW